MLLPLPSFPVRLQHVYDLPMGHGVLARGLQRRAVSEIQHHGERQLLSVEIGNVRHPELVQREFLCRAALVLHRLWDDEAEIAMVVNGDYSALPELCRP